MAPSIHRITGVRLHFIPVQTRVPLKFGSETLTSVTCARAAVRVVDRHGNQAEGWGETPLSVQWVWPDSSPYEQRHAMMCRFCCQLARAWAGCKYAGHPLEIGHAFQEQLLHSLLTDFKEAGTEQPLQRQLNLELPWLAALVCNAAFDLALHDAFGNLIGLPTYETYGPDCLASDLANFLDPAENVPVSFRGKYPSAYLESRPSIHLPAWHLVGGLDLLESTELRGDEHQDGYPLVLTDWIQRDGLKCLKVKLRGNDANWDAQRLIRVGRIALTHEVEWLSADFNCTVQEPAYVNEILDRLSADYPKIFEKLLYVEQPFPYELERHRIKVDSLSARKPLFLDESAHDWKMIRLGRELGWTGVALKTCKTQTGALLSACWAKAHGMSLMVQDLTNPMLAQIPHVLLAAHVGTIMGVETNAMQFYPEISAPESKVHPGLYQRRNGIVDLSSVHGPGFGYRVKEIQRDLPEPAAAFDL